MNEELKPCPFCGSEIEFIPSHVEEQNFVNSASIICRKCRKEYVGATFIVPGEIESEELTNNILINWWNTRPAEDEKDKEIAKLKEVLEIQKNLTRQACFESNRAYDEMEKLKKMFYDLVDKQALINTNPKVIIIGKDTNVPANATDNNVGSMEENNG